MWPAKRRHHGFENPAQCTLPLTGEGVVDRIITDLGVMDVTPEGLKLVELAPDVTFEDIQAKTGVPLIR